MKQAAASAYPDDPLRLPHTDWLRHDLIVTGPHDAIAGFREAAVGVGSIPWQTPNLDLHEEDRLHALLHPPDGSAGMPMASARVLARLLREAIEAGQRRMADPGDRDRACPFDLHALLPIPRSILHLGPDDAASVAWLRSHWGVVQALRHVRVRDVPIDGRVTRFTKIRYEFWSADWSPWAAFAKLRKDFPLLGFDLRPDYGRD